MVFRWILAPMLGLTGLLCFGLGATSIGLHIRRHLVVSPAPSLPGDVAPFDAAMLMFLGAFLVAVAALFFDARRFSRLSEILLRYAPNAGRWPLRLPTPSMAQGQVHELPADALPDRPSGPFVFVSYSHQDEAWRVTLVKWLARSLAQVGWSVWTDRRLASGYRWTPQLARAIDASSIALCLVTQEFVASDFIAEVELPALRQRPQHPRYGIDWIPISKAMVEAVQLHEVQALWSPGCPVATLEPHQQLAAMREIVLRLMHKVVSRGAGAPDPPLPR